MSNQPPGGWPPPPMSSPPPPGGYPNQGQGGYPPPNQPGRSSYDQPTVIGPQGGQQSPQGGQPYPSAPPPPGFPPPPPGAGNYPPAGFGGYPPPGGPPRKSRKGLWIALGIVAVLVVGAVGAVAFIAFNAVKSSTLNAGDCVAFSAISADDASLTEFEKRGCEELSATYEVGQKLDSGATCADTNAFPLSLVDGDDNVQKLMCLIPNLQQGSCYLFEEDGRISATSCESTGRVLIDKRIDGQSDPNLCADLPADSEVLFTQPPRTYCATIIVS